MLFPVTILENKTAKAEDYAMKLFEEKNHETIDLKEKNNEIHKLDQKCEKFQIILKS